jgi:peptide/nickel transport system ATP-binding protein
VSPLLELTEVSKRFEQLPNLGERLASALGFAGGPRVVHAVDRVSLTIQPRETVALVGESGCGKSTLGRLAAGILPPSTGTVRLAGQPVMSTGKRPRKLTTRVQSVFQDPFASLNPRRTIAQTISEGPLAHRLVAERDVHTFVGDWLTRVGLDPSVAGRYPHQFSGGQRQRVAIARALAMQPDLVICDEPVASLDVSIQAQILNLLLTLRRDLGLTCLFISHDLGVVRHISDRVAIMYLGRIVETGPTAEIFQTPQHPYTKALLASVPRLVRDEHAATGFDTIAGELPSPLAPPSGCHFHPRCRYASDHCQTSVPALTPVGRDRAVACLNAPLPIGDAPVILAE